MGAGPESKKSLWLEAPSGCSEPAPAHVAVAALVAVLIGVAAAVSVPAQADEVFASVGTGEPNGVYYPVGKAIYQIVNS